jgi:hypothetical protein
MRSSFVYSPSPPARYHDDVTALNYNYHRDYDPATGRYVKGRPMGFVRETNFEHDGKTFKITVTTDGRRFATFASVDGQKVTLDYTVQCDDESSELMQKRPSLVDHLIELIKWDIGRGWYSG